jgi:ankyrin repeat protein
VFPNPQNALSLSLRPDLEQYRKLAKELVKACQSADPGAIGEWADRWLASLWRAAPLVGQRSQRQLEDAIADVEEFATRKVKSGRRTCALADAQFVLARAHGFESWRGLVHHLDRLAHPGSEIAGFEAAADAIMLGDEPALRRLLHEKPELIRARSDRDHGATLLHYAAANGVENYRQRTPPNIVAIVRILLDAGAEVDAEADVYGGGCTTLGLVATSQHPRLAGVQNELLQLLLDRGAQIEKPNLAGNRQMAIEACIANGCPEAAEYVAGRGAFLGLREAAAVGRLELVRTFAEASQAELTSALQRASGSGRLEVVLHLLERGADPAAPGDNGDTALHRAAFGNHLEVVKVLLARKPPLEALNQYGGTVLSGTLWGAAHSPSPDAFIPVIETLLDAGAEVRREPFPKVSERIDALLAQRGGSTRADRFWLGDEPRRRKGKR